MLGCDPVSVQGPPAARLTLRHDYKASRTERHCLEALILPQLCFACFVCAPHHSHACAPADTPACAQPYAAVPCCTPRRAHLACRVLQPAPCQAATSRTCCRRNLPYPAVRPQIVGSAGVRIVFEETYGELVGADAFAALPRFAAPSLPEPLRPPAFLR